MRKRMKRGISSLLCVAMVLGMLVPVGALAEEETLPTPDQIETGWNGEENAVPEETPVEPTEDPAESEEPQPGEDPAETEEPLPEESPAETEAPQPEETPEESEEPQPEETPTETEEPQPEESPAQTEEPQPEESLEPGEEELPDEELLEEDPFAAFLSLRAATDEYEIYPTPHSITYVEGDSNAITLPATLNVVYESGIDQYTKARAAEAFDQVGVSLSESGGDGTLKLRVGIEGSGGVVDTYFNNGHQAEITGLYDKYSAYQLLINADGIAVLGVDTDAAFYGLTTVKAILQQVEFSDLTVRMLTVEDYADMPVRGFIEGYYGNPWTVEDRAALMEFGGDYKMNIYFYAPKDDPKHRNEWKSLYTEQELNDLIRPLAEAGNKSKCYYGYALHPFAGNCFRFDTQAHYDEDIATLKAKFLQVIKAGVRQISLLGDDANMPENKLDTNINSYVKVLNDLTDWVEELRTTGVPDENGDTVRVPDMRSTVPFCAGFMRYANGDGNDDVLKSLAPQGTKVGKITGDVPIVMTGGRVWGDVGNNFINNFTNNVGVGPFLWINWPCSDNSQTALTMGAHGVILRSDLTAENAARIKGIMVNPMQQSEPSKAGIFQLADYSWNVWNGSDSEERIANVWDDCFKYVDHDTGIETPESAALRELSKHMIHQKGNGNNNYDESFELAPKLTAFSEKMEAETLTDSDISDMRAEFQTLYEAACLYKNKTTGNLRILGSAPDADGIYPTQREQMAPWLDCWEEFSASAVQLLDTLALILDNADGSNDNQIVQSYLAAQSNLERSRNHSFFYVNGYRSAQVGTKYIIPFVDALMTKVAETAQTIVDPSILIERVITNRTDTPNGGLEAMRDGDPATEAVFKTPNSIAVGTYVGVQYNRPITLDSVRFEVGTAGNSNDTFNDSKLQYMDANGQWLDIPGATFGHADLVLEATGLGLEAKGVRAIATSERTGTWFGVKEIYINGKSGPEETDGPGKDAVKLSGSVIKPSGWSVYENDEARPESNLTDGNDNTFVWYSEPGNKSVVGDYIGLDLGEVKNVGWVRFVVGGGDGDKWTNFKLQYSADNSTWTDVKTFAGVASGRDVVMEDLGGVEARYVRLVNTVYVEKWVKFSEISVYAGSPERAYRKIAYQSDVVKKIVSPVGLLEKDSATLSADNVILRPGEFVGVSLPEVRSVTEIVADYSPAPGLVLKVGMNEAELYPVSLSQARSAMLRRIQLFAGDNTRIDYDAPARFVRLENEGTQAVSFVLSELSVQFEPMGDIVFLDSNIDASTGGYPGQDARNMDTTGNWFDGDINTVATYAHTQAAGDYVTYDLGRVRPVKKLTAIIGTAPTSNNYIRQAELQISLDKENWTTVAQITKPEGAADNAGPADAGWTNYSVANFVCQSGELAQAQDARYLRVYLTGSSGYFPALAEILINDGEYLSVCGDRSYAADPIEPSAEFTPDKIRDGDMTTGFRPNMAGRNSGSLIYRLSGETSLSQINLVRDETAGVTLSIRAAGETEFRELGTVSGGLSQTPVDEEIADVAEIKLSWGNVTPTFYELITVPREKAAESGGGQAPSAPETVPINSYSGSDCTILFDENWKFNYGDASGAQEKIYNDGSWRTIDLPHDYSIELEYTGAGEAESGYLLGGIGWYRKSFTVSPDWANKVVTIDFGGVYMDSEVYLNGTKLGEHHYGYTPFSFVLPNNLLDYSGENVIAVKCDNPIPTSRWYSGSGIYRSVHLTVSDPVHVARYGTKVETTNGGDVTVKTNVENSGSTAANVTVKQEIFKLNGTTFEKDGAAVATNTSAATSVSGGGTSTVIQTLNVTNPALWNSWDKGTPNLYVLKTTVLVDGTQVDTYETEFGFREIAFDHNTGFQLNGVNVKLKGVCQHHDQGALGAEAWYRALERQVEILMDMGCNSIRVTHNPAADELIEICNRKGMLIIDEAFDGWAWAKNSNSNDFARWFRQTIGNDNALVGKEAGDTWAKFVLQTMIKRNMNAPSVIMYSLGNEVQEGAGDYGDNTAYVEVANQLISWAQAVDTTRPVTRGSNNRNGHNQDVLINQAIADAGGVVGFNYATEEQIKAAYNKGESWIMYGSETASHINSRGVYTNKRYTSNSWQKAEDANKEKEPDGLGKLDRLTSYDKNRVGWGALASTAWWRTIRFDYNAGEYVWTGFDYIGEPTPWNGTGSGKVGTVWPKSSFFGIIDTNGLPKDNYWLYRSMWNEKSHTLHILPTWDREDLLLDGNGKAEVVVYTDAPMVKLYLNDVEVGTAVTTTHRSNSAGGTGDGIYTYRTYTGGTGAYVQKSNEESLYATFHVTYAPGTLRAEACDADGTPLNWVTQGRKEVKTTSGASKLVVTADRSSIKNDGRDLSYITISVTDAAGNIVNGAANSIKVSVSGNGRFMGMDNGVQADHTSYQSDTWKAGAGQVVAIVQSTKTAGTFTVSATADGLSSGAVTVTTGGVDHSSGGAGPVSYELSKTVFVQLGVAPDLPATAEVTLGNGTKETKDITWNSYDPTELETVGNTFSITGVIEGYNIPVSIGVMVLDDVVALLNYSAAVKVGQVPVLPAGRPAVMADGTVVEAQFPVTWEEPDPGVYSREGKVTLTGTAEVFGKEYTVSAVIRVSKGSVAEGSNVMSAVSAQPNGFTINGVDNGENRAVLDALRDGDAAAAAWTGSGTVNFAYDTAQNFYRAELTFTGTVPASGVTVSVGGTELALRESRGNTLIFGGRELASNENMILTFANEVSLAEVELITGTPVFDVGSTAELDDVKVNGESATAAQLADRLIKNTAAMGVIYPESRYNVACTLLPENADSQTIIVTESEDHTSRDKYVVQLDAKDEIEADDDSRDYPYTKTTATAPSQQTPADKNVEGPVEFVVDDDPATYWHSNWNEDLSGQPGKRYVQLELEEATKLAALRYKPRPSVKNGIVTKYRVEVSTDGATYTPVAEGDWAHDTTWKVAMFDSAVTAKYVRLYGVETKGGSGDTPNKFMSCAELRVVLAPKDKIDLSQAVIMVEPNEFHWKNVEIRPGSGSEADQGTRVTVTLFGEELQRGVDYVLDYDNNVEPGTAYIYARALSTSDKYKGAAATTFTITKANTKITSFEPMTVRAQAGVAPTLPTTVWACMDDQHHLEVNVTWDAEPVGYSANYYVYPQAHEYILKGHIAETDLLSDPTLQPQLRVKMGWSESVDGVSLVTGVGVIPSLPNTVTVQFDDGTSGERTVSWALDGADFSTAGIVEVTGVVTGIDRVRAKASVRVVEGEGAEKLLSQSNPADTNENGFANTSIFPFAMAWHSSGNNNPYVLNDGSVAENWAGGWPDVTAPDRWSDWERNTAHDTIWAGVAFATSTQGVTRQQNQPVKLEDKMASKVVVRFVDEGKNTQVNNLGDVTYPATYEVEYYVGPRELTFDTRLSADGTNGGNGRVRYWTGSPLLDDANWRTVSYVGDKPEIVLNYDTDLTVEFQPVCTPIVRVKCTHRDGTKWVGMTKLEVYGKDMPGANSTFTVSSVTLGGVERLGDFDGNKVLNVELAQGEAIPKLALTVDSNARVSITQSARVPGMPQSGAAWATATVTSEDGSKTETYTVKFTRQGAPEGYYIELDLAEDEKDKITLTPNGGDVGTEITVTVPEGYALSDAWVVIEDGDREGEHVHVTDGKFIMPVGNVRFSARVSTIPYTITYDLDGGAVEGHNTTSYNVETVTFTLRNPSKEGYTFAGWTGTGLTEPTMTVTIAQGSTGDREYRALWSKNGTIVDPPEPPGPDEPDDPTPPGPSGGSGSSSNTTTRTDEDGNRIVTTEDPRTGKVTVTTTAPDGTVTSVVTTADGKQTATATLSKDSYGTVELAMPKLKPEAEPQITVNAGSGKTLSVVIPFEGGDTVVAVRINKDGTETVVPLSVVDERGLRVKTEGTQTFKLVDNKKKFTDVSQSHWAAKAVNFAASRELFNGMGSTETFVPEGAMDRAMLTTVLWRMAEKPGSSLKTVFADVQKGSWYEDAVRWGVETGVVKGTDYGFEPEASVTRETLAVMLYRAAGSPAVVDELPRRFTDNGQVSDWAQAGMIWAVQMGIINGRDGERLAPKDTASRAEVAAMLQRYVNTQV